jgi:predicted PurR-regulated permease PerM
MSREFESSIVSRSIAAVLLLALSWLLREPAMVVFGAILFAATLHAMADPLARHTPLSPRAAVGVVLVALATLLVGGLWLVGDPLSEQLQDLRSQLPQAWQALQGWLQGVPFGKRLLSLGVDLRIRELPWANIANMASGAVQAMGALVLVLLMGVYVAFDVRLYREGLLRLFPLRHRDAVADALDATGGGLSRWLLGQLVTMGMVGITVAIGMALLHMPMALALGLISGLLEFVPFIGPIASGTLAVLVAFVQGPEKALWVALLFLAIQQVEGNLLVPLIQRWAVRLPPALAVLGVLAFGTLFGWWGVMFGTPLMVVTMILVRRLYVERALEGRRDRPNGGRQRGDTAERADASHPALSPEWKCPRVD